jgi:hypothetical protein
MFMNSKVGLLVLSFALVSALSACRGSNTNSPTPAANNAPGPVSLQVAGPMPDEGFKAEISIAEPPKQLRAGQVEVLNIKIKNTSNVVWWQRGGETNDRSDNIFYIAAGNRWLDKDGKLTSEPEGHNGIPRDLKPGEEAEMALQITAPKTPGEWTLDLDMVQEGVSWFSDKGSPTTKVKVTVVK